MPTTTLRARAGLFLAVPALTASTVLAPAVPAVAATPDPAPAAAGAAWLTDRLDGGLLTYPTQFGPYTDHGLSIDTGLALAALGEHDTTVGEISDGLAAVVNDYITGEAFGDTGSLYAGPTGKALVMAQTAGDDPTSYGGEDLVALAESAVSSDPLILGRIEDVSSFGDNANVLGQAYVAQGLTAEGSTLADDATAFLLQQQCSEGYFRLYFTEDKEAVDQSCDGGDDTTSAPDTDATAIVLLALAERAETDLVAAAALEDAEAWLRDQQKANGSFGGGTTTEASNTNSTGLAGWALGEREATGRAEKAAQWVRAHQAVNVGKCTPWADDELGAVAYNRDAWTEGRPDGITDGTLGQWLRASAQALPALQWAPTQAAAARVAAREDFQYFKANSDAKLTVSGMTPGDLVCGWRKDFRTSDLVNQDGGAKLTLRMPGGTGERTFKISDSDSMTEATFSVLGRLDVPFRLAKETVRRGGMQTVRVRGLAPYEFATVQVGTRQESGEADAEGRFVVKLPVGNEVGKVVVRVFGQFIDLRHNRKTFTVTR